MRTREEITAEVEAEVAEGSYASCYSWTEDYPRCEELQERLLRGQIRATLALGENERSIKRMGALQAYIDACGDALGALHDVRGALSNIEDTV